MIALNEKNFIARALSSCTFADEIVVVDGGSTDGTVQILQSHSKVKLIHHPWDNHFGRQREISLRHCCGDWIIRLDADEAFSMVFEEQIRNLLETTPEDVAAYRIKQCNLVGSEKFYSRAFDQLETYPRIWKNRAGVRWERSIHEKLSGITGRVLDWPVYVVHYGFLDKTTFLNKGLRYARIPGSQVNKPEDLVFRNYDFQPAPREAQVGPHVISYTVKGHDARKPQIAIVRGPHLNRWEIQLYQPLQDTFNLVVFTTCMPPPGWTEKDIPIITLPEDKTVLTAMNGVEFALFDADIIFVSQILWPYTFQAVKTKDKFEKKIIALQWDRNAFAHETNEAIKYFKQSNKELVDVFIADTPCARDALLIEGVPSHKIVVIPTGIGLSEWTPDEKTRNFIRRQLRIKETERVVLVYNGHGLTDGIDEIVHAAKLLESKGGLVADSTKYIIASQADDQNLIKKIEALNLKQRFIYCSDYSLFDLFNCTDILFLPCLPEMSWQEPPHMLLRKALSFGLPIIATAIEGIPDEVGDAAILIPKDNPGALCAAILELFQTDQRRTLCKKARSRAETQFSAERTVQALRKLFGTVFSSIPE